MRNTWRVAIFSMLLPVLWTQATWGQDVAQADLCDVAPLGAPDGEVNKDDVTLIMEMAAGLTTAEGETIIRADTAPIETISVNPVDRPQLVRPNPAASGDINIGDAVVAARRAAGDILFVEINRQPTVTLAGDGEVVISETYAVHGGVTDDAPLDGAVVEIRVGGLTQVQDIPVDPATGGFEAFVTLTGGPNIIDARATDSEGRTGEYSLPITVRYDSSTPTVIITQPTDGAVTGDETAFVQGSCFDNEAVVAVRVNGLEADIIGEVFGIEIPLNPGENVITAVAEDNSGNLSDEAVITVTRDIRPPTISLIPPPALTNQHRLTLNGTVSDDAGVPTVMVAGVEAVVTGTTFRVEVPIVAGENQIIAIATDQVGNEAQDEAMVVGDFNGPVITLESDSVVSVTEVDILIGISEQTQAATFEDDPMTTVPPVPPDTLYMALIPDVALHQGQNIFEVTATDLAGNASIQNILITLDTAPPIIEITAITSSDSSVHFDPPGALDGVVTNGQLVTVEGLVSDNSGVGSVTVNGRQAVVTGGSFVASGVRLSPMARDNQIIATATDLGGTTGQDQIVVTLDITGPDLALEPFDRGSFISVDGPLPNAVDGSGDVNVMGALTDRVAVPALPQVRFNGHSLNVTGTPASFAFTIPHAMLANSGLAVLEVDTADLLGNEAHHSRSALVGHFTQRNHPIANAVGAAIGGPALDQLVNMLSSYIQDIDGTDFAVSFDLDAIIETLTIDLLGISLCIPSDPYADPIANPAPGESPYRCEQYVYLDLTLTPQGVQVSLYIPEFYADLYLEDIFPCDIIGSHEDGYFTANEVYLTMVVNFADTPQGPTLVAVPGTVDMSFGGSMVIDTESTCIDAIVGLMDIFGDIFEDIMESVFEDQIDVILDGLASYLRAPLYRVPQTDFSIWLSSADNSPDNVTVWMDVAGDPCAEPGDQTFTWTPCPIPELVDPGILTTPDTSSTRPNLVLGGNTTLKATLNDDFVNYVAFAAWVEGYLFMDITTEMLGEEAPITLDTTAFSLFIPDLMREDVQAVVPDGTEMAIRLWPLLPFIVRGNEVAGAGLNLDAGDIVLEFVADVDGNPDNGFEFSLFSVGISLLARADMLLLSQDIDPVNPEDFRLSDMLALSVDTPIFASGDPLVDTMFVDLVENPLVLPEEQIRATMGSLIGIAMPLITDLAGEIPLPGSLFRFRDIVSDGVDHNFTTLAGDLVPSVTFDEPVWYPALGPDEHGTLDGAVTDDMQLPIAVSITDLSPGPIANVFCELFVNGFAFPLAAQSTGERQAHCTSTNHQLQVGANEVVMVVTDGNRNVSAYVVATVTYDPASGGTAPTGSSDDLLACSLTGPTGSSPWAALIPLLLGLLAFFRRRRPALPLRGGGFLALALALALVGISGCGDDSGGPTADLGVSDGLFDGLPQPPDLATPIDDPLGFTGAAVGPDPVVVFSALAIGDETQGFDLDSDSAVGDPEVDNALSTMAALANDALVGAMEDGAILILVQFLGLHHLPEDGQEGVISLQGYLGIDLDDDPSNNLNGLQDFAVDPLSYDENGDPLIIFRDVTIKNEGGVVTFAGGPSRFELSIPIPGMGELSLSIDPTFLQGELVASALREGGLEVNSGLLGGVVPAAALAVPIPGLGIAPLTMLAASLDIDLNNDGVIDHTADATNQDGVSVGVTFAAVPAGLADLPPNEPPQVTLNAVADPAAGRDITMTGTVTDPDHPSEELSLTAQVNDGGAFDVELNANGAFSIDIELVLGENTITVIATDPYRATGQAVAVTHLEDQAAPTVEITGPEGPEVSEADQTLTGFARDDVGIASLSVDVNGTIVALSGEDLGNNGAFSVPIVLTPGANTITVQALDLADNVSDPATKVLTLLDGEAPILEITGPASPASGARQTITGTIADNGGLEGVSVLVGLVEGDNQVEAIIDTEAGTFAAEVLLALGENAVEAVATDGSGNVGRAEAAITVIDETPPEIEILAPAPLVSTAQQTMVLRVIDDSGVASVTVSLNGAEALEAAPTSNDEYEVDLSLAGGANRVVITATDIAGNDSTLEGEILLQDAEAPTIAITRPTNGARLGQAEILVEGTAQDNAGIQSVTVYVNLITEVIASYDASAGTFTANVTLQPGENTLSASAIDLAGNYAETEPRVVSFVDPTAVGSVEVNVDPSLYLLGQVDQALVTARVTLAVGDPAPDGTMVTFTLDKAELGFLSSNKETTVGGEAAVAFTALGGEGVVKLSAEAGGVTDSTSLVIGQPSAVALSVCADEGASFAGLDVTVASVGGGLTVGPPDPNTSLPGELAQEGAFHTFNTSDDPVRAMVAGNLMMEGPGEALIIQWPLEGGVLSGPENFDLESSLGADLEGLLLPEPGVSLCGAEYTVADMPPVVDLDRLPSPTGMANQTITGSVRDEALSSVTAVLRLNGVEQALNVSSGTIAQSVTLAEGVNVIQVEATDRGGNVGSDEITVVVEVANPPPTLTLDEPGEVVTEADVTARGTVSDDGGLEGLVVRVSVGGVSEDATIEPDGAWHHPIHLVEGNNQLRVMAIDGQGAASTINRTVKLVAPVNPPVVTISAPTDGASLSASPVEVRGRVDEGGSPVEISVQVYVDNVEVPTTFNAFSREFEAEAPLDDGANVIRAVATDVTGGEGEDSVTVTFSAPDNPPTIAITFPANGARLAATVLTVIGTVQDDRGVDQVTVGVTVNGAPFSGVVEADGTWSSVVQLSEGANTIVATATDRRNQTATAQASVEVVEPPVVILDAMAIGRSNEGFNVDELPPPAYPGDPDPDNALSGLGAIANGLLDGALHPNVPGDCIPNDPDPEVACTSFAILLEFEGLVDLPAPNQSVTVNLNGYLGTDDDGDPTNNYTGTASFGIDPMSFDDQGRPLIRFENVVVRANAFGEVTFDTFADGNPMTFAMEIPDLEPPLTISVEPAYVMGELTETANGIAVGGNYGSGADMGLLGGVVPACTLAMNIEFGSISINPLELLVNSVDVDLNGDGVVDKTHSTCDDTEENPDGISVGLTYRGVPARLVR